MSGTIAETGILQRMIGSDRELSPEVAQFFLDLSFSEAEHKRMAELSEKANEGELTPDERDELSMYVVLNDFLVIMHSHARGSMNKRTQPGA